MDQETNIDETIEGIEAVWEAGGLQPSLPDEPTNISDQLQMSHTHNVRLTSAELAGLWTTFQNDTLGICVFKHVLQDMEDADIKPVFEQAVKLARNHVQAITKIFETEHVVLPFGFNDKDVNLAAPRLFSDALWLQYLYVMNLHALTDYGLALANSSRTDIRDFFVQCNTETMDLFNQCTDVSLSKGLYSRPPYISTPRKAEFVKKQSFLNGWFGDKRPLSSPEITNIFFNVIKNMVCRALKIGFSQVAKDKDLRNYILRASEIYFKHNEVLSGILHQNDLPSPKQLESDVTNSTISPFSDRLIMYHELTLIAATVGFYGQSMAFIMRRDLGLQYQRLILETVKLVEDGAELMINKGWMEQAPQADDRKALARTQ